MFSSGPEMTSGNQSKNFQFFSCFDKYMFSLLWLCKRRNIFSGLWTWYICGYHGNEVYYIVFCLSSWQTDGSREPPEIFKELLKQWTWTSTQIQRVRSVSGETDRMWGNIWRKFRWKVDRRTQSSPQKFHDLCEIVFQFLLNIIIVYFFFCTFVGWMPRWNEWELFQTVAISAIKIIQQVQKIHVCTFDNDQF